MRRNTVNNLQSLEAQKSINDRWEELMLLISEIFKLSTGEEGESLRQMLARGDADIAYYKLMNPDQNKRNVTFSMVKDNFHGKIRDLCEILDSIKPDIENKNNVINQLKDFEQDVVQVAAQYNWLPGSQFSVSECLVKDDNVQLVLKCGGQTNPEDLKSLYYNLLKNQNLFTHEYTIDKEQSTLSVSIQFTRSSKTFKSEYDAQLRRHIFLANLLAGLGLIDDATREKIKNVGIGPVDPISQLPAEIQMQIFNQIPDKSAMSLANKQHNAFFKKKALEESCFTKDELQNISLGMVAIPIVCITEDPSHLEKIQEDLSNQGYGPNSNGFYTKKSRINIDGINCEIKYQCNIIDRRPNDLRNINSGVERVLPRKCATVLLLTDDVDHIQYVQNTVERYRGDVPVLMLSSACSNNISKELDGVDVNIESTNLENLEINIKNQLRNKVSPELLSVYTRISKHIESLESDLGSWACLNRDLKVQKKGCLNELLRYVHAAIIMDLIDKSPKINEKLLSSIKLLEDRWKDNPKVLDGTTGDCMREIKSLCNPPSHKKVPR